MTTKDFTKNMKTFKVTFFDKFDIFKVETFHNVADQTEWIENLAVQIVTLELAPFVRCESNGEDYTESVNHFLKYDICEIDANYYTNYLERV